MGKVIYLLCAVTSFACAAMLVRGWFRSRARLLLWAGLCFAMLTVNNALLFVDYAVYPDDTLVFLKLTVPTWRGIAGSTGLAMMLWGLIWDSGIARAPRREFDR